MIHLLFLLASLTGSDGGSICSVDLLVEAKTESVDLSNYGVLSSDRFEVRIRNTGPTTITLVEPGDGSDVGWRTSIVTWQAELLGSIYELPESGGRCGNINPLRPDEVFELKPGESHVFGDWIPDIRVIKKGTYRLQLSYKNDPKLKWSGTPLAEHDPNAMERIRQSTACIAVSNEVVIEVTGVPGK